MSLLTVDERTELNAARLRVFTLLLDAVKPLCRRAEEQGGKGIAIAVYRAIYGARLVLAQGGGDNLLVARGRLDGVRMALDLMESAGRLREEIALLEAVGVALDCLVTDSTAYIDANAGIYAEAVDALKACEA